MSDTKVVFLKNGKVEVQVKGSFTKYEWLTAAADTVLPLSMLMMPVQLEEGTTLGQFLEFFINTGEDFRNILNEMLLLAAATEDILDKFSAIRAANPKPEPENVKYTEVYLSGVQLGYPVQGYRDWLCYHGVGEESYAIEFSPISDFWDLPLKIDASLPVYERYEWDGEIGKTTLELTAIDVLYAIVNEMTFFGTIESKEHSKKKMKDVLHLDDKE